MRVLGVDPGLRRCGWGVVDQVGNKLSAVAHGVIAPDPDGPLSARLSVLFEGLAAVLAAHRPSAAAVEDAFMHANASSALKLGHARAAALLAIAQAGLPAAEYAPRLVKKTVTGAGAAEKEQVAAMVSMLLPGCRAKADAADALAVAICHAQHAGSRVLAAQTGARA